MVSRIGIAALLAALALPAPAAGAELSFRARQLGHDRVRGAYAEKQAGLQALCAARGLAWPPQRLFLRHFKRERLLEAWAGAATGPLRLLRSYDVCAVSGGLGPKREAGDGQVPEGAYTIENFNPESRYHLSLRVGYPNAADRRHGVRGRLGGDVYIHGNCVTIGCVPITDDGIRELYVLAVEARQAGDPIPVHLFPARLDAAGIEWLAGQEVGEDVRRLWQDLRPAYELFEATRVVPAVRIGRDGRYRFERAPRASSRPLVHAPRTRRVR